MLVLLAMLSVVLAESENKVKFNTTILDSPVDQVVWCGASVVITADDDTVAQEENESATHKKVVFVLSSSGVVYRSVDYGFKWTNVTDQMVANFSQHDLRTSHRVSQILQSPADSKVIYFIGTNGISVRTYDCGRNYGAYNHSVALFGYKLNKMDPKLMMAFIEKPCSKGDKLCKEKYRKEIHVTRDSGATWKVVMSRVREASWDKLLQYVMVPDNRIVVSYLADNGSYAVSYSDDYFKSNVVIRWHAFGYYQTPVYLFLLVKADPESEGYDLEISPSFADTYRPREIVLPLDDSTSINPSPGLEHTFTVLDTSEGQVFLSVSHDEDLPKLTNIYMSDATGNEFTVSLLGNVRSRDTGNCDFEHVQGIEGVYIANVYDHNEVAKFKSRRKGITEEEESKKKASFDRLDPYKKTQVTYDRGGNWHPLRAPKYDADGQQVNCNGDCALHLKGRTESSSNPIYSSQSAAGIIIATGNTGLYLTQKSEEINTYLSRDGGHNWFEILRGSHIYEIGDHGGLILLSKDDKPTNTILFTWDEGQTFERVKFSENFSLEIDNILTEPSNMEQKFLVIGRQDTRTLGMVDDETVDVTQQTMRGVILSFDFTSLHQRVCSGQWSPGTPDSDYEFWIPMNFVGDKCLFGKKIKFLRRKRSAKCFNPEEAQRTMSVENCPCTEEDWECDFGFYRKIEGGDCVQMSETFQSQSNFNKPPKNCEGTYRKTQGYKKIPGDQCEGGVYLGPIDVDCPGQTKVEEEPVIEPATKTQTPSVTNKARINTIKDEVPDAEVPIKAKPGKGGKTPSATQKPKSTPEIESQVPTSNRNVLLGILLLIVLITFREQIRNFWASLLSSKPKAAPVKRNYYPKSDDEELRAKPKGKPKGTPQEGYEQISLFKADEDEEAGL